MDLSTRQESVGPLVKDEGALCSHSAYYLQRCLQPTAPIGSLSTAIGAYYESFPNSSQCLYLYFQFRLRVCSALELSSCGPGILIQEG